MMRILMLMFLLIIATAGLSAQSGAAEELAAAERAFSAAAQKNGINAAFLEFLDEECVMFAPLPVNGKELYRRRKETGAVLSWYPTFVEVSHSGDLGISTGPWQIRRSAQDTVGAYGHYFSVWEKGKEGRWSVVLDNGIGYPASQWRRERELFRTIPDRAPGKQGTARPLDAMTAAEVRFSQRVAAAGLRSGIRDFAADDIRWYIQDHFPVIGKGHMSGTAGSDIRPRKDSVFAARVAASGDLGYLYGVRVEGAADSTLFIHVWRKEQQWKMSVMLEERIGRP